MGLRPYRERVHETVWICGHCYYWYEKDAWKLEEDVEDVLDAKENRLAMTAWKAMKGDFLA